MLNIQFNYLYRDAGNYKTYGSVIFSNKENLSIEFIKESILKKLIDQEYFVPKKWNVPLLSLVSYDAELDHEWYEFVGVVYTQENVEGEDIQEFLAL